MIKHAVYVQIVYGYINFDGKKFLQMEHQEIKVASRAMI